MKKESLFFSASLLILSNLSGRGLSLFYRILLARFLGPDGMGLYQSVSALGYSASGPVGAGLVIAVSQVVAREKRLPAGVTIARLLKWGFGLATLFSVLALGTILPLAQLVAAPLAASLLPLRVFWPLLVLPIFSAVWRGYFLGKSELWPLLLAQVNYQLVRLFWLFLPDFVVITGLLGHSVLLPAASSFSARTEAKISWVLVGLFLAEVASGGTLAGAFLRQRGGQSCGVQSFRSAYSSPGFILVRKRANPPAITGSSARGGAARESSSGGVSPFFPLRDLVLLSITVILARLLAAGTRLAELSLISQRFLAGGYALDQVLHIYGLVYGLALPLVGFPGVVTGSLALALVPRVSAVQGQKNLVRGRVRKSLLASAGLGLMVAAVFQLGGQALAHFFLATPEAGEVITALSLYPLFLYLEQTGGAVLRGLGWGGIPLLANLVEATLRLGLLYRDLTGPAGAVPVVTGAILAGGAASSAIILLAVLSLI